MTARDRRVERAFRAADIAAAGLPELATSGAPDRPCRRREGLPVVPEGYELAEYLPPGTLGAHDDLHSVSVRHPETGFRCLDTDVTAQRAADKAIAQLRPLVGIYKQLFK